MGKSNDVIHFLQANDFEVVWSTRVSLAGHVWRELWRYQLNVASVDRLCVTDTLMRLSHGLLFLAKDRKRSDAPASNRLSSLKGPADPKQQTARDLRARLGQSNAMLSLVHVADEPVDIVRELGILTNAALRRDAYYCLSPSSASEADYGNGGVAVAATARVFDAAASLARVQLALTELAAIPGTRGPQALALEAANRDIELMRSGATVKWRQFSVALADAGACVDPWDMVTLGSSFAIHNVPNGKKRLQRG